MHTAFRLRDGLTSFPSRPLERLVLEQLLGDRALQPRVLALELLETLRVLRLQPAVLGRTDFKGVRSPAPGLSPSK